MELIDWRELYSANRAAIDAASGRTPISPDLLSGRLPSAAFSPTRHELPAPRRAGPRHAGAGAGAWERCVYDGAQGRRPYFVYTPPDVAAETPLVVMLHGCTQSAAALARSTGMNLLADRDGFVVAYPQQDPAENPMRCWNWFLPAHQARDGGEAAVLAAITGEVLGRSGGRPGRRACIAGMSAGGAMAAVAAATHPDVFSAVGIHSGLAYRSATSQQAAFGVLKRGASDPQRLGREAHRAMGSHARVVPTVVIHGDADQIVAPINGDQLVQQWLTANHLSGARDLGGTLAQPTQRESDAVRGGHRYSTARWLDPTGRVLLEYLRVEALGHAWSGGSAGEAYSDPRGPSASEALWRFFARACVRLPVSEPVRRQGDP